MNAIIKWPIQLSIVVDGRPLPVYLHGGQYYIAGEAGKPYTIRVTPEVGRRLLVVESVDGRNVLHDEAASLSNRGMVISHTWENHGWRIDDDHTRDFVFGSPETSVAAQATLSTSNVGVIGVAVWEEKVAVVREYMGVYNSRSTVWGASYRGMPSPDSAEVKSMMSADMGTSMGAKREDHIGHTAFERGNGPVILEVQYRSRQWLVDNGIVAPELPKAFPGSPTGYEKYRLEE